MRASDLNFYGQDALLYRLHEALKDSPKEVVFIVGAPLTAAHGGHKGVADVSEVVNLVKQEFGGRKRQLDALEVKLISGENKYQEAFDFLTGHAGQDAANKIIKKAVAQALVAPSDNGWEQAIVKLAEPDLTTIDQDANAWSLSPAVDALGRLLAKYPDVFGKTVLTSNFDPLIEVSVRSNGKNCWRTALSNDGSFLRTVADGCQVIHIHGYWHGSDTLHTTRQLLKNRPSLKNDLLSLLQDKVVVVLAYGGWPDIFTGALEEVVKNENSYPEVLWAFYDDDPVLSGHLSSVLQPGIDRNRVILYKGVDCHSFLPELLRMWEEEDVRTSGDAAIRSVDTIKASLQSRSKLFKLAPLDCDRPPSIEVLVGRESELRALEVSAAKVAVISGLGGEGKSVLAASYISNLSEHDPRFTEWDWRDCKEQSDRIRTQVSEIITRFSGQQISSEDLVEATDEEIADTLVDYLQEAEAVVVLDNVDSYVDLENKTFTGLLDTIVVKVAQSNIRSRIIITCRPDVQYTLSSVISFTIKGITLEEALELFAVRAPTAAISLDEVTEAHALTNGHAFWLDLLAVQVNKVPGTTLKKLMDDMRRGREGGPDVLSSIWHKLPLREQTLLRFMAEAVRPETEQTIQKFSSAQLTITNFKKAFRSLISLNLIVVKQENDAPDLYDLHPLVRQFVRTKFERAERTKFIQIVIRQYDYIIGAMGSILGIHLPFSMLERWSQKAELQVSAGLYDDAFSTLVDVQDSMIGGGHLQEYIRVARLLFEAIDWETAPNKYKDFDKVVENTIHSLEQIGDSESVDRLLDRYEATVPQKTARYIKFCDVKGHVLWMRDDFEGAIDWATRGVNLKEDSQVDTVFDCKHTLALALRDVGDYEEALKLFLRDKELEDIVKEQESMRYDGSLYGNVGRCLHLMGRLDEALICYGHSLRVLEDQTTAETRSNRAYGRRWVGQILSQEGDRAKAVAFFIDAIRLLGSTAPRRVKDLCDDLDKARSPDTTLISDSTATRIVSTWIRKRR